MLIKDYHLLSYDSLDSTNEEAKRLAGGGASHGAFIWAKKQTDGKGRLGRKWFSPEGNLYISVLLCPECGLDKVGQLSFVAAIAVASTITDILPDNKKITCKWPNDILCDGKKIGGILLESFSLISVDGEEKIWVIVGLGLNIDSFPSDARYIPTSLQEQGVELISAKIVLSRFVYNFSNYYDIWQDKGFSEIKKEWTKIAHSLGSPVKVEAGDKVYEGIFTGIDKSGSMKIESENGVDYVSAGDASFPMPHKQE